MENIFPAALSAAIHDHEPMNDLTVFAAATATFQAKDRGNDGDLGPNCPSMENISPKSVNYSELLRFYCYLWHIIIVFIIFVFTTIRQIKLKYDKTE